jgi:predicted glycosyltransferase
MGLGHTNRSSLLSKALINEIPNLSIAGITGSSKGYPLLPPEMDLIKLPSYLSYDKESGLERYPILQISEFELFKIRSNILTSFLKDYQPQVLIVDFLPKGIDDELVPAIIEIPKSKLVIGLRGIIWDKIDTMTYFFNSETVSFIDKYFSIILIYIDPKIFRLEDYYNIPTSIRQKFRYVGYLHDSINLTKIEARNFLRLNSESRTILVSFGGGQGSLKLWIRVMETLNQLNNLFDSAYFATGPYMEDEDYKKIISYIANNPKYHLSRFLENFPVWMKASDLFISAGGSNALGEIIASGINAIVVPRQHEESEQEIHSNLLAELELIEVITMVEMEEGKLLELIKKCIYKKRIPKRRVLVGGAKKAAEIIKELL